MRSQEKRTKFWVLIKGRQPRQDYGEGVLGVKGNQIWLNAKGEAGLRHTARLASHVQIGGVSIQPYFAQWLAPALAKDAESHHKIISMDRLPSGLWSNSYSLSSNKNDEDYVAFPSENLARTHAELLKDHERKASVFNGLSRAFKQANADEGGVVVIHPHNYPNLMATRDTLRHENTHQVLNTVVPEWEHHLFGEGDGAEQLLKDADIRDAVHNLTQSYGENSRLLHNELIARLGNRDGLKDLRLDPESDKYFRVLSKVLDAGVKHHGADFYRIFQHAAPIYRDNFYAHIAGHQSHPDFGVGVSDIHRDKIFLSHDGQIGAQHIGLPVDAQGRIAADHVPSLLERIAKERDVSPYKVHREPQVYTPGFPAHYALAPATAARPEQFAKQFQAPLPNARRHIELMANADLKRDLFHGLHRAIGEASEQSAGGGVKIIEPLGIPQWTEHSEMSKASRPNRKHHGFVFAIHRDWNAEAARRLGQLLEGHRTGGRAGLKSAWQKMLLEGGSK